MANYSCFLFLLRSLDFIVKNISINNYSNDTNITLSPFDYILEYTSKLTFQENKKFDIKVCTTYLFFILLCSNKCPKFLNITRFIKN